MEFIKCADNFSLDILLPFLFYIEYVHLFKVTRKGVSKISEGWH